MQMEKIIERSNAALDHAISSKHNNIIPAWIWRQCKGVAIINCSEFGFVVSVKWGDGLVIKHNNDDGTWGAPSAISFDGTGAGAIFGKADKQVFLFPMTQRGLKMLASGHTTKLGIQLGLAVGPGREAESDINIGGGADVTFSYTLEKGVLLNAGLSGTKIDAINAQNKVFYNKDDVNAVDIVMTPGAVTIPPGKGVEDLHEKLHQLAKE